MDRTLKLRWPELKHEVHLVFVTAIIEISIEKKPPPWNDGILYNHYRPIDPGVVLSALASPSEVEVFHDVFFDANGKLEASNL